MMAALKALVVPILLGVVVVGCSSPRESTSGLPTVDVAAAGDTRADWPAAVADGALLARQQPLPVEVGVVVFNEGIRNPDARDARDKLRSVETRLAAAYLRDILTESGHWGPVRVLPSASHFAALTVSGEIVHSDGRDFVVDIRAVDASNRVWLQQRFHGVASAADYAEQGQEPFRPLFVAIANRLVSAAEQMSASDIQRLLQVADLRYAEELAPAAFSPYLAERDGYIEVQRLPADSDPMLARIERIRNQEALFIDTVDEQYVDLGVELGPTYMLWRRSSLEQAEYLEIYTARAASRELKAEQGSFAAMQQVYSAYRSVRIQEQDLFELATGFDNETAPTVLDTGENVVRLSGTLEQQYDEWRKILGRIIVLEQGNL